MKKKSDSTSYIKLFILIVLFAAFISLSYKALLLVKNRSFRFNTYNIMLVGNDTHIISFNTKSKQINILEFSQSRDFFSRKKPFSAGIASGVLLDGVIVSIRSENFVDSEKDFPTFFKTLSLIFEDEKYVFYDVNKFDLIKLLFIAKVSPWEERTYTKIEDFSPELSENASLILGGSDKFRDQDIFNEKISVEIINSTALNGLGSRVGFMLQSLGANVISIRDGDDPISKIFAKTHGSKTLRRIERMFSLKAHKAPTDKIADITVNLGHDLLNRMGDSSFDN